MTCPECGHLLDNIPVSEPCPGCGGSRRDAKAHAQAAVGSMLTDAVTIEVGYGTPRPWVQKWQDVLHLLQEIEDIYSTTSGLGNDPVRQIVEGFFKACRELPEWIERTERAVEWRTDWNLQLCDGMAQTTKHHTRNRGITARVATIRIGPQGVAVSIDWSDSMSSGTVDALDLARACVAAWRQLFARNGITPTA